jgi:hypothetical protein
VATGGDVECKKTKNIENNWRGFSPSKTGDKTPRYRKFSPQKHRNFTTRNTSFSRKPAETSIHYPRKNSKKLFKSPFKDVVSHREPLLRAFCQSKATEAIDTCRKSALCLYGCGIGKMVQQ